mgnify:CR=1 FL=1
MLEKVNLKASITKEEYKKEASALKEELSSLQQLVKQNKLPVIIVFEGWVRLERQPDRQPDPEL